MTVLSTVFAVESLRLWLQKHQAFEMMLPWAVTGSTGHAYRSRGQKTASWKQETEFPNMKGELLSLDIFLVQKIWNRNWWRGPSALRP